MLVLFQHNGVLEGGEQEALEDFGRGGGEGDGPVARPLVCGFVWFQQGNYSADFPQWWNNGLINAAVKNVC